MNNKNSPSDRQKENQQNMYKNRKSETKENEFYLTFG